MVVKNRYLIFLLIVSVNIILKLYYADINPFWYDEIISVKNTLLDFGHIKHEAEWDNNPPFYYYCLWVWHKLFPISEFNSRLLSVIFISVSIGLVFVFAQKHFNTKTAFLTVILLSLSNFLTFYAQEARAYSLVLLLVLVSTILFFKYLKTPSIPKLIILSLVNFLIIYTHYIAGIVLMVQYLVILCFFRNHVKNYFTIQSVILIILVLVRFTKKQFLNILNFNNKKDFWLKPAKFDDLVSAVSELFFNPITAIVFTIIFFIFIFNYYKSSVDDNYKVKLYCLLLGFGSVLVLFTIGTYKSVFLPRYLIFCIPFAALIVVHQFTLYYKYGWGALITLICIQLFSCRLAKSKGQDYKSVANVIKVFKKSEDAVIINTRDNLLLFVYYYNKNYFVKYKNLDSICAVENIYGINDTSQLKAITIHSNSKVFLLQSFHNLSNIENILKENIGLHFKQIYSSTSFKGVEFSIFKKEMFIN